jgi:hypothetical protein
MASHDAGIEKDITEPNERSSSNQDEKQELANIEDVERQKEQVEARLSRFTKEEEEAVIRKLDWHLMPLIFVLYSLSVLDRSNLGNAKIAGMQKDINIGGNRYAWLGTIFYISCTSFFSEAIPQTDHGYRYSFPMDANGMESLPSSSMGRSRSSVLGHGVKCAGCLYQLGRTHGLPLPASNSRSHVRARCTPLPILLLPPRTSWTESGALPLRICAGKRIWWSFGIWDFTSTWCNPSLEDIVSR